MIPYDHISLASNPLISPMVNSSIFEVSSYPNLELARKISGQSGVQYIHYSRLPASPWDSLQIGTKLKSACRKLWILSARHTKYTSSSSTYSQIHALVPPSNFEMSSSSRSPKISSKQLPAMSSKAVTRLSNSLDHSSKAMVKTLMTMDYHSHWPMTMRLNGSYVIGQHRL